MHKDYIETRRMGLPIDNGENLIDPTQLNYTIDYGTEEERSNPVGSTSTIISHENDHFSILDYIAESHLITPLKPIENTDFGTLFGPHFDGVAYGLKTAMLNDTLRVSLNHPSQTTPVLIPKNGRENGRPPTGIVTDSIFLSNKTGITDERSITGGSI